MIGQAVRVLANGLEDRGSSQVIPKTQKWYLMPLLNIIRYRSRVK